MENVFNYLKSNFLTNTLFPTVEDARKAVLGAWSMEQVRQTARSHRLHHEPGLGNHTGSVRLKARRTGDS